MNRATRHDDEMPAEIDFSRGKRGQFYRAGAQINLPVYLERQVQEQLAALASVKGVELSALINELLKKGIELIEIGRGAPMTVAQLEIHPPNSKTKSSNSV